MADDSVGLSVTKDCVDDIVILFPAVTRYKTFSCTPQELKEILRRACNTWSDIPPHILHLCDETDTLATFLKHF